MGQMQVHNTDYMAVRAGANEPGLREIRMVGDTPTITRNLADEGETQSLLRVVRSASDQVIAAEAWKHGQRLYWHAAAQVITTMPTDTLLGVATANAPDLTDTAETAKAAAVTSAWVLLDGVPRSPHLDVTLDFALMPTLGAVGSVKLRDYQFEPSGNGQITALWLSHDGNLAPGAATIQIGTTADPDKFLVATDVTTLSLPVAYARTAYPLPAAATVLEAEDVVLTITVAAITAGRLRIEAHNNAF